MSGTVKKVSGSKIQATGS